MKPFVLSQDLEQLFKIQFQNSRLKLGMAALQEYRRFLASLLLECFENVVVISEESLTNEVEQLALKHVVGLPIINMSGLYLSAGHSLSVNRVVDAHGDIVGDEPRRGSLTLSDQITQLRKLDLGEVVLYDEVIFSGHQANHMIKLLQAAGIEVVKVLCGIAIGEGKYHLATEHGVEVYSAFAFDDVIDEICEHDFTVGAPRAGRVYANTGGVHAPYLLPFGNPVKWASVPEAKVRVFSQELLEATIQMYQAFEKKSKRVIECRDVEKTILLPFDETPLIPALMEIVNGM